MNIYMYTSINIYTHICTCTRTHRTNKKKGGGGGEGGGGGGGGGGRGGGRAGVLSGEVVTYEVHSYDLV
jgi:hypothetical protein